MKRRPSEGGHTSKNVENTVFLRFTPYDPELRRHTVQDVASDIGPIKKCSIIHKNDSSYGFCKFTCREDAVAAAVQLNQRKIGSTTIHAELAAPQQQQNHQDSRPPVATAASAAPQHVPHKKKTSRIILRNLSFYAKEKDIRKAIEPLFGPLDEVHIPMVGKQSRGFAFLTFQDSTAAQACCDAAQVEIRNRPVQMAWALHKTAFEGQKERRRGLPAAKPKTSDDEDNNKNVEHEDHKSDSGDDDNDENDQSDSESENGSEPSSEVHEDESAASETANHHDQDGSRSSSHDRTAVREKRCLFMRNLPFDCTRHDVFELFREFGHITAVYLVKENNIPKGTAFVSFKTPEQAEKALSQANSAEFVSQRDTLTQTPLGSGLFLKGRQIFVNLAVDKETAKTLTTETGARDRRNLYLKGEGRVENTESSTEWDDLAEVDKMKRQTAWSDKNTKLKSPLFFINPKRLSIRNLSKSIDEAGLKRLCTEATMRGLGLVDVQDQVAHWKASGTMNSRDLLARAKDNGSIPPFDEKNVKQHIPSIHVHRDFASNNKKGTSRGFGFCEFEHHAHALACLRELNNNPRYSGTYAAGLPSSRLIVEFTVENKVKARQQAEHREKQRVNQLKQQTSSERRIERKPKGRGAVQREKKRKQRENPTSETEPVNEEETGPQHGPKSTVPPQSKVKKLKPPKKKPKVDASDANFAKLVESYKKQAVAVMGGASSGETKKTRWFEE